jgi:hypothetical protein
MAGTRPDPLQKDTFTTARMTFDGRSPCIFTKIYWNSSRTERQRRRSVKVFRRTPWSLFGGALLSGAFCWLTKKSHSLAKIR